jgi:hypothetical protein
MQFLDVAAVAVLLGAAPQRQNRIREAMVLDDTAAKLRAELVAIHDRWYRAFDVGDGATMDALEVDDLVLVMPDGSIWAKPGPRAGKQRTRRGRPWSSSAEAADG